MWTSCFVILQKLWNNGNVTVQILFYTHLNIMHLWIEHWKNSYLFTTNIKWKIHHRVLIGPEIRLVQVHGVHLGSRCCSSLSRYVHTHIITPNTGLSPFSQRAKCKQACLFSPGAQHKRQFAGFWGCFGIAGSPIDTAAGAPPSARKEKRLPMEACIHRNLLFRR